MAKNNHDTNASYLLCLETISALMIMIQWYDKGLIFVNDIPKPFTDLPSLYEESFGMMLERENQHSPKADYLNILRSAGLHLSMRIEALDWIWKRSKNWTVQLLALACLSLAIKMEETNTLLPVVLKERVMRCLELIQDLATSLDGGSAESSPESPNGVLEAACFLYNKRRRV